MALMRVLRDELEEAEDALEKFTGIVNIGRGATCPEGLGLNAIARKMGVTAWMREVQCMTSKLIVNS